MYKPTPVKMLTASCDNDLGYATLRSSVLLNSSSSLSPSKGGYIVIKRMITHHNYYNYSTKL